MKHSRKIVTIAAGAAALALTLTACSGSSSGGATTDSGSGDYLATLVGGVAGDLSYTDSAISGLQLAADELGVKTNHIEAPDPAQGETLLRSAIQTSPDLLLSITLPLDTVISIAEQYPDQLIGMPDQSNEDKDIPDNLELYAINTHEGSFLAGLVAGTMSTSKKVGQVVGGDSPALNQFAYAYEQGVKAACDDCTVQTSYLNFVFDDPALGKATALDMISDGVDVIYQVAGGTGTGVIEAAEEQGVYAIGVDSNQDDVAPGTVITSMMKHVDASVLEMIKAAQAGEFTSGVKLVGLSEGATGLSWDEGSTTFADAHPELADQIAAAEAIVAEYRATILDGSYEVCDALNAPDSEACASIS
ncbi:BMP family ABC transporter substrate-binding protein [Microbacterium sp. cx-55]|uniref:BMP family ABC transporter substrate-binding protein n=1 Tax=unclassified Microbacterium TaxID=2609290 RepID=UPI001CBCE5C8|nr:MULTISPECIES: BMP family ABC transporter substrate-binding protein [unclassified Microbacterium]MBZ4488057.1 BMP family ABC transporter substrate-binding protein [Microbacterium sp. cx-55]MCC4908911.1 BMP family ABC transporter substrate-binding protein [Microbacterium sp. cx-59]UGB34537.1 BMP family ABC transporter substrate-binding protein [Microbacterium sp. cx-55]